MAMYIAGYGLGRFWVEGLRIDRADELAGLRWNQWVAIAMVVGGSIALAVMRRNPILEEIDPFDDVDESVTTALDNGDLGDGGENPTADGEVVKDADNAAADTDDADPLDTDLEPAIADPDD
jgi:hypothetical protein